MLLRPLLLLASLLSGLLPLLVCAEARAPFDDPATVRLTDYLPIGADHDPSIPVPADVIGHEVGARHVRHDALVAWFRLLAASSDRVQLRDIGRTWEGRPQITAVISSPENLARLDELKAAHLAGDPDAPVVVWLGYSVHGNEASGTQASMVVAWHLAAARAGEVPDLLDDVIVLIDPSINPDGYGRFSSWNNQTMGRRPVGDREHRERDEPWPGGRTNHYYFDLNRDWLMLQQPESRNRIRLLNEFRPHVVTDHHEMGSDSTFFFQPGVPVRRFPLIPDVNQALTTSLAEFHAEALDAAQRNYFSAEGYDDFYPGKGATWPDLQGGIGILFEQASSRGMTQDTANGLLTLPMALHNHVIVSLSTLRGAHANATGLKAYRRAYLAGDFVPKDLPAGWLIDLGTDRHRARALLDVLAGQDIEVRLVTEDVRAEGHDFPAGRTALVPLDGPQAVFAHTLFQPLSEFADSTFYDVSTWSLQYAFGVEARPVRRAPGATAPISALAAPPTGVQGRADAAAWALPWNDYFAPAVLQRLHEAGIRVQVALAPFEGGVDERARTFEAGTVVVQRADVEAAARRAGTAPAALLTRIAADEGTFIGVDSGLTAVGLDLGSRRMPVLAPTKVALLAGDGVRGYSAGTLWHMLDARLGIPVTLIAPEDLDADVLARHTHLVLADGRYGRLGRGAVEALDRWVRAGGVLIAVRGATAWAREQGWLPALAKDAAGAAAGAETTERLPYGDMAARDGAQQIGGAIVEVELDLTHPIAFGIGMERIGLLRRGRNPMQAPADDPFAVVGAYTPAPRLSGYLPEGFADEIAGTPAVLAIPKGRGAVIAFADAPAFRAVWWVGERLVANAIAFGATIEAPSGDYEEDASAE